MYMYICVWVCTCACTVHACKNVHIEHNRTTHYMYIQMDTCVFAYIIHEQIRWARAS